MNDQLPPPRRRTTPELPDPMAPAAPAKLTTPSPTAPAGEFVPAFLEPALGVSASMAISVRTSEQVRAMFDALAADDAQRNRARLSNRHTLDALVTEAYQRRFKSPR